MELLNFKFKPIDDQGQETGFRSKRGSFDGEILVLDEAEVPAAAIIEIEKRDNRLLIIAAGADGEPIPLFIAVTSGGASNLKRAVDLARSKSWATVRKQELEDKGQGHLFRQETCPRCRAALDLSGLPETPQLYCSFCDALLTVRQTEQAPANEADFRICDHCGMFSKPRRFNTFYFYFLIVVYGWRSAVSWRCPACMKGEAWKMFGANLPFVVGWVPSVIQLARAYGSDKIGGAFAGLHKVNIKAAKGDLAGAVHDYQALLERVPYAAGVHFNLGQALAKQGDLARAARAFEISLDHCANYSPSVSRLAVCYERTGEDDKLRELMERFGANAEDES